MWQIHFITVLAWGGVGWGWIAMSFTKLNYPFNYPFLSIHQPFYTVSGGITVQPTQLKLLCTPIRLENIYVYQIQCWSPWKMYHLDPLITTFFSFCSSLSIFYCRSWKGPELYTDEDFWGFHFCSFLTLLLRLEAV